MRISIIVPVYNTEDYLRECLESIAVQSYKDFEAILVDDGSTDNSGKICDEFAEKDTRFKVIHKKNGGVSSARNAALDCAKGEYVGFVDSDDTVSQGMFEELAQMANDYAADIVQTSGLLRNGRTVMSKSSLSVFDNPVARKEFFSFGEIKPSLCAGIYERKLFEGLRFPEDIHFWEDFAVKAVLVSRCTKVCITSNRYYNYRRRAGSATYTLLMDKEISSLKIYDFLNVNGAFSNNLERHNTRAFFIMLLCRRCAIENLSSGYGHIVWQNVRIYWLSIMKSELMVGYKLLSFSFLLSPKLASSMVRLRKRFTE